MLGVHSASGGVDVGHVAARGLVRPRWRPASAASSGRCACPRHPDFDTNRHFAANELTRKQTSGEMVNGRAASVTRQRVGVASRSAGIRIEVRGRRRTWPSWAWASPACRARLLSFPGGRCRSSPLPGAPHPHGSPPERPRSSFGVLTIARRTPHGSCRPKPRSGPRPARLLCRSAILPGCPARLPGRLTRWAATHRSRSRTPWVVTLWPPAVPRRIPH
jgi:hypothetical protein